MKKVFNRVLQLKYLPYALLFLSFILSWFIPQPNARGPIESIHAKMNRFTIYFIVGSLVLYILLQNWLKEKGWRTQYIIIAIVACSFLVRLAYISHTTYSTRQHDVGTIEKITADHFGYIRLIATTFKLPTTNDWQFNHPPFFHLVAAIFININYLFKVSTVQAFENLQILTLFFTSLFILYTYKFVNLFKLSNATKVIIIAFVALNPALILASGSLNNDFLAVLLSFIALYYAIVWLKDFSIKYAIITGIIMSLAILTKANALLMLFIIFILFLIQVLKRDLLKKPKTYIAGGTFAIIILTLGFSYIYRNWILFDQYILYVAPISKESWLYRGDSPSRFLPSISNLLKSESYPYLTPKYMSNIFSYTITTSLFGEYTYWWADVDAEVLLFFGVLMTLLFLFSFIYVLRKSPHKEIKFICTLLLITQLISYIIFQITYPFACTSDFRYLWIIILPIGFFLGECHALIESKSLKTTHTILIGLFLFSSVMFYLHAI